MKFYWFFILVIVSSCTRIPEKDLSAKLFREAPYSFAVEGDPHASVSWPEENWWEMFDDAMLNRLIETAFENNPSLRSAEEKVKEMLQLAREKFGFLLPEIDAYAQTNWQRLSKYSIDRFPPSLVPAVINQIDIGLSFSYEFDFWGKNLKGYRAALGMAKAQAAETAQTRILLAVSVSRAYFTLKRHMQRLALLRELLQSQTQITLLTKARFESAVDPQMPVLETDNQRLKIQKEIAEEEEQIQKAEHLLAILLGDGPNTRYEVTVDFPEKGTELLMPQNLPLELIARRADVMAQLWKTEAGAYEIGVAKTLFYPNINLSALVGLESLYWNKLFSLHAVETSLKPAITLPIFKGGRLRANLMAKAAAFEEAAFAYNNQVLAAVQDVADSLSAFKAVQSELQFQKSIVAQTQQDYELYAARYSNGIDNLLTLLSVQEALYRERITAVELEFFKILASVGLIRALGGGYESSFKEMRGEYRRYG